MAVTLFRRDGIVAEFDCRECGNYVVSYGHPDEEPTCATCRFLQTIADPVTKEQLRQRLLTQRIQQ